MKFILGEEFD